MPMLSVRLPEQTIAQLDELAAERRVTRTRVIRQLLDAGLADRSLPSGEPPTEEELVALLSERARAGNVAAIGHCWRGSMCSTRASGRVKTPENGRPHRSS